MGGVGAEVSNVDVDSCISNSDLPQREMTLIIGLLEMALVFVFGFP